MSKAVLGVRTLNGLSEAVAECGCGSFVRWSSVLGADSDPPVDELSDTTKKATAAFSISVATR